MIFRDDKIIMIMDDAKMYSEIDTSIYGDDFGSDSGLVDSGMSPSGGGMAEFAGKMLEYEEYSDGEGSKTRFFFEGDKLAGIRNIGEEYGSC